MYKIYIVLVNCHVLFKFVKGGLCECADLSLSQIQEYTHQLSSKPCLGSGWAPGSICKERKATS